MGSSTDPKLANRILFGLIVGLIAGLVTLGIGRVSPEALAFMQKTSTNVFDPIGQIFLRLLFFVIIPLVFASLASGVVQLGRPDRLGPLAARTFVLFFLNMGIAVVLGLVMMNTLQPGAHLPDDVKARLLAEYGGAAAKHVANQQQMSTGLTFMSIVDMFMPRNLLGAVAGNNRAMLGEVLPLILFAILVGVVGTSMAQEQRQKLQGVLDLIAELMTGIVHFALRLAPYAVPLMIYSVIVKIGIDIVLALGFFVAGCIVVMAIHLFGTMSIWIRVWTRFGPLEFFGLIKEVLVTAFSTSSSSATLPTAMQAVKEKLGVSPSTAGFVLPLGTTMNMSGTALFEGCTVLFVAQVFGVHLTFGHQITLTLLAVLSAVAVAGIPGGSLPLIAGLLITFGIPAEGIGIVLGVDRILDMCRTTTNVGSDVVTTAVVDAMVKKSEAAKSGSTGEG